jgi:signal transduction histidine kinase
MLVEDLRPIGLFDGLSDEQLAELLAAGEEVHVEPGVELFREGAHADGWWVLVDGAIDLSRRVGREDVAVGRMDVPGRWAGGFRAWDEQGVYLATGRGAADGRALCVPADALRNLMDTWFPFGVHLVRGLYRTARSIESTARQRDSLVTLGRLAAGLAHELNNPAGAAARAADSLDATSTTMLESLARLAEGEISSEQFVALDALRRQVEPGTATDDPLALADATDALSAWLARHGVAREWMIAPSLAEAGIDVGWCDRVAELLGGGPSLEHGLEWVASTLSVRTLVAEVKESTRRVSELVAAVRSYTQMDRASRQETEVQEGLDSTLVMLGHKLRGGVRVVREYGADVPPIQANPGELNQVWTNLVDNAVDAMDGNGTLRVTTRSDGEFVVVEIGDTGTGFTPEAATRAFEAFYTTKAVGKGTGLGLDIARRIIAERHGGTIEIDRASDETVLRVSLPLAAT